MMHGQKNKNRRNYLVSRSGRFTSCKGLLVLVEEKVGQVADSDVLD